jgi:hypothetical protein
MSDTTRESRNQSDPTLTERVRQLVLAAREAEERRTTATRGRVRRARPGTSPKRTGPVDPHTSEVQALRAVFRDFGVAHREYRERTGEHIGGPLRDAALAFKREPSLISLVTVAGFLDDLELLR